LPVEQQVLVLYVLTRKYFSSINVEETSRTEKAFLQYIADHHSDITDEIRTKKEVSDQLEEKIKAAIEQFLKKE
jgi:F-type H+-transporting ATPase subunit alpha